MKTKIFEFDNGIVNVSFDCLPTKETLEKPCIDFMNKVLKTKEKANAATLAKDKLNR